MAIFAVTLAIGYPLAFDARADERDTRGFTSIKKYLLELGSRANCTLHPPSISSSLIIFIALSFSILRSWSERVMIGATTMESPV